jgi:nicotinamidase-related amidase
LLVLSASDIKLPAMAKAAQNSDHDHLLDAVALVVVDVQERLLPAMADPEVFTDRVAFSIEAAKLFGLKIIFTEQVPEKLGRTPPRLKMLAPKARVFSKSSFSAFQAKGIQDYLRDLNIYHLLICGLETGVCIYQTALQASDLELDVTLLSDGLTSRRPEDDAFVLPSLTRNGCHILPSETVFYSMVADAQNPRFRAYSELVKKYHAIRQGLTPPPPKQKESQKPAKKAKPEEPADRQPPSHQEPKRKQAPKRDRNRKRSQPVRETPAGKKATTPPETRGKGEKPPEEATLKKPRHRRRAPRSNQEPAGGTRKPAKRRADQKSDSA